MKKLLRLGALATVALVACSEDGGITDTDAELGIDPAATVSEPGTRVYEVTIENLTTGQPFSPGVVVTHTKKESVFRVGEFASEGIRLIAENGEPSVAEAELSGEPGVHEVVATTAPIHRIGGPGPSALTVQITARANFNRLSLAVMLICTNDAFTGLDGVKLPGGFEPETHDAVAYDAGTEANDELYTSIVDPCGAIGPVAVPPDGNNRTPTSDVIAPHPGIAGVGDLDPASHGWVEPVARITIRRVKQIRKFEASLEGAQEVPPVDTDARGSAAFKLSKYETELRFDLRVADIEQVTQAHIHLGAPGVNGPVVAFLFGFVEGGVTVDGKLSKGTLTDEDVIARPGFDGTLAALIEEMRSGDTYVNVHTVALPSGEIRGQIMPR